MRRYGLSDSQWERIKDLLPGREGHVGGTAANNRLFVEAVLYRYRAGIPWRDLPARFGDWKNVHKRLRRWCESGIIEQVFRHLAADRDNDYMMIDSTIVRAHQHSAGARKKGARIRPSGGPVGTDFENLRHCRCRRKGGRPVPDARAESGHHGSSTPAG